MQDCSDFPHPADRTILAHRPFTAASEPNHLSQPTHQTDPAPQPNGSDGGGRR